MLMHLNKHIKNCLKDGENPFEKENKKNIAQPKAII